MMSNEKEGSDYGGFKIGHFMFITISFHLYFILFYYIFTIILT